MAVTHPKTPDGFADGMHFHIQYHGMPDEHAHPGFCEMLFVLSGKLAHTVNGEEEIVGPNTLVFLSETDRHTLTKLTDDAYYLCLGILTGRLAPLIDWVLPDTGRQLFGRHRQIVVRAREATEISALAGAVLTAPADRCAALLRVMAMTFVKRFALGAAQTETENVSHPAVAKFVQYAQLPVYLAMSLDEIVGKIPYSYPHLNRLVTAELHCSAGQYLQRKKLEYAKKLLTCTDKPLETVAEALGYSDYPHFSAFFKKNAGLSPGRYRKSGSLRPE